MSTTLNQKDGALPWLMLTGMPTGGLRSTQRSYTTLTSVDKAALAGLRECVCVVLALVVSRQSLAASVAGRRWMCTPVQNPGKCFSTTGTCHGEGTVRRQLLLLSPPQVVSYDTTVPGCLVGLMDYAATLWSGLHRLAMHEYGGESMAAPLGLLTMGAVTSVQYPAQCDPCWSLPLGVQVKVRGL